MSGNLKLLEDLASVERKNEGRECYAFSDIEDEVIERLAVYAYSIFLCDGVSQEDYEIKTDALGSLFVTYYGEDRTKTVVSGSHVDSVLDGGDFDGLAGVNSAFGFLERLVRSGKKPKYNYTAVAFRAEESSPKTEFSCLGSLVATGLLSKEKLEDIQYSLGGEEKILLKEFFCQKYGEERWNEVIAELENPPLKKDEIVAFEELHIEQSAVCEVTDADVGIVTDGIGGAIREKVEITLRDEVCSELEIGSENPHVKYTITIKGEAAHTGGTPPNRKLKKRHIGDGCWYRTDALLATGQLLKLLDRVSEQLMREYSEIKISKIGVAEETGFTTVPKEQVIEIAVDKSSWAEFELILERLALLVEDNTGVEISYAKENFKDGPISYYSSSVLRSFDIPLFVERMMRETVIERSSETGVGKVRGTATDFVLSDGKVRFKLDYRDVDTEKIEELVGKVREKIGVIASRLNGVSDAAYVERSFEKKFAPLDADAVEIKKKVVEGLGLTYAEMPSLPGHDAWCLAVIGVPVAMTYVRHNGISHSREEGVESDYYEKAEQVSHGYLQSLLEISPDD